VSFRKPPLILLVPLALAARQTALACATCYGASDAPLARGMNWGIVALLGVIGLVLFGITVFFVHLGIKSARLGATVPAPTSQEGRWSGGRQEDCPTRLPQPSDSRP
jgi:hypothetical protein